MNEKYRVNEDGSMDIKRKITSHVGPFETFYEVGEAYFPCMDVEGDDFFKLTLLVGLFGGHKVYTKNYGQAFLYFLTLGLCGIGYVLDLIMIITGNYSYMTSIFSEDRKEKKRVYSWPLENKKKAIIMTLIAAVCAYFLVKYMYWTVIIIISELLSQILMSLQ